MAIDPREVEQRARRALELGRVRAAAISMSPLLGVGVGIAALVGISARAVVLSVLAYGFAVYLWWRGERHLKAIAPGLVAGVSILAATLVAHGFGHHHCDMAECVQHCLPMGLVGGLGSGVVLVAWAGRFADVRSRGWWVESVALAAVFGSVGCSCIGFIGGFAAIGALTLVATPAAALLKRRA